MLDSNQLTNLPTDIGQLARLEKLSVSNNALLTLPTSIGQLQKLCVLDVSSNSLSELPTALAECSQLEEGNFSNNDLQVSCTTTMTWYTHHLLFPEHIFLTSVEAMSHCCDKLPHPPATTTLNRILRVVSSAGDPTKLATATEGQDTELHSEPNHQCTF